MQAEQYLVAVVTTPRFVQRARCLIFKLDLVRVIVKVNYAFSQVPAHYLQLPASAMLREKTATLELACRH